MVLDEQQKQTVGKWVEDGYGLSDIQKALADELGITMTYMDVRFLLIDLDLALKEEPEEAKEPESPGQADDVDQSPVPQDGVSVELDRLMKPGALVSGTVTFSDGRSGTWALDQMGRLALDMGDPEYKPAEQDIADFQKALQEAWGPVWYLLGRPALREVAQAACELWGPESPLGRNLASRAEGSVDIFEALAQV